MFTLELQERGNIRSFFMPGRYRPHLILILRSSYTPSIDFD